MIEKRVSKGQENKSYISLDLDLLHDMRHRTVATGNRRKDCSQLRWKRCPISVFVFLRDVLTTSTDPVIGVK